MDLDWLKDFLALAEHKTFSRAADARNVTQPAFGRRIRSLEEWMGAPLFIRSAQGAALTPAGTHFHPFAAELMRNLERVRRDTRAVSERETVTLSIAATHALSFTFFPAWIRRHVRFDGLGAINLISESMEACEQIMLAGEVHFLLCHHQTDLTVPFDPDRYPSVRIGDDALVPLCAPTTDGQPAWPVPGSTKKPSLLLGYSQASGLGRILAAQASKTKHAGLQTVFTAHLAATLLSMAREGQGAAWLPLTLVEEDLRKRHLVKAASDELDIPIEIRLFRSLECRNRAADELWASLTAAQRQQ